MKRDDAVKEPIKVVWESRYRVYHKDLSAGITRAYGFAFDFMLATGTPQGFQVEYEVDGYAAEHTDAAVQAASRLRSGRRTHNIPLVLNTLALDGLLPFGTCIITTDDEAPEVAMYRRLLRRFRNPLLGICRRFRARFPKVQELEQLDNAVLGRPNDNGSV